MGSLCSSMGSSSDREAEVSTNRTVLVDKALDVDLAKIEADNRIEAHVKATEDAYRARVGRPISYSPFILYEGEYAQLDDQVYDQYLAAPQMQQKLTQLAHALIDQLGDNGSVTVTDDVVAAVPKLVQKLLGSSDCDKEKHAYMEALLKHYRDVVKRTSTWPEAFVKEFLDSLFTGRTLLATSLINGAKTKQKEEEMAKAERERERKIREEAA